MALNNYYIRKKYVLNNRNFTAFTRLNDINDKDDFNGTYICTSVSHNYINICKNFMKLT